MVHAHNHQLPINSHILTHLGVRDHVHVLQNVTDGQLELADQWPHWRQGSSWVTLHLHSYDVKMILETPVDSRLLIPIPQSMHQNPSSGTTSQSFHPLTCFLNVFPRRPVVIALFYIPHDEHPVVCARIGCFFTSRRSNSRWRLSNAQKCEFGKYCARSSHVFCRMDSTFAPDRWSIPHSERKV